MKKYIVASVIVLIFTFKGNSQMSESGSLGLGIAFTSLNYGLSAKYNFTDVHTGQVIIGSANYGYGFGNESSFALTGRYAYNFEENDIDFANWKPYLYGQLGYWTYKYNDSFGTKYNFNAIAIGAGGGIEWSFIDFVYGLAFSFELGFTSISFEGLGSIGGFNGGFGVHYYFNL